MFHPTSRRGFLQAAAASAAVGMSDLAFLDKLPSVRAEEAKPTGKIVQFRPEIEPLVRLIEDTPRDKLLETVAARIRAGLPYRDVLAGLLLAGVRNVQPRPSVGFKFHSVLVVNSAHLASISSPDEHRWLPIFWALDYFKQTQAEDVKEGDWTMAPVNEAAVPDAAKAATAFREAMDRWDEAAADTAVAGLARTAGALETFEIFFRYGARDFRDIGHKAIYVANSYRTLSCIGWQHAEGVLRSLAYALQAHRGEPNPAKSDLVADRPWRRNLERAAKLRKDWTSGKMDDGATKELLSTLRTGTPDECCELAAGIINRGVSPQSVWDAALLSGGELLFRQRGIVALHALTTANALYFAYQTSGDDNTRRMMLLQCAAFVPMFRDAMRRRGDVREFHIEAIEPQSVETSTAQEDIIFGELGRDRDKAAAITLGALKGNGGKPKASAQSIIDLGRVLVFLKGNNAHDYKFSSAVLEDYYHVSPAWRDRFLAAGVYNLRSSGDPDNALVKRIRAAFTG
jgi:hypothetical protein